MQAIQNALQKWLFPIAQKLEQQRHLQSVKDGVVAIIPIIIGNFMGGVSLQFGGTSLLIIVGVALETVKQIESEMTMRNYQGFLK